MCQLVTIDVTGRAGRGGGNRVLPARNLRTTTSVR